jgi:hypothetical protein
MTKKQRKTLDDALAEQFVYGETAPANKTEPPPKNEKDNSEFRTPNSELKKESSLMEKLQLEPKEVTKRFTVDLPETMHRKLSILSAKTGRTKADIVRMLLEETLKNVEG